MESFRPRRASARDATRDSGLKPSRRWVTALCACAVALGVLAATPWGTSVEGAAGLRLLFAMRGERPVTAPVSIVALRRASAERVWLPGGRAGSTACDALQVDTEQPGPGWSALPPPSRLSTWPRCVHGRLVDALREAGVRAIVFDVLFRPRQAGLSGFDVTADDAALANAMRRSGNVVLAQKLEIVEDDGSGGTVELAHLSPALEDAAYAAAPFPLPGSRNDEVRQAWVFLDTTPPIPTFPAMALHGLATRFGAAPWPPGMPVEDANASASALRSSMTSRRAGPGAGDISLAIPAGDPVLAMRVSDAWTGPDLRWINFYGGPGALPTEGFDRVLAREPATLRRLEGRVVFVGYVEDLQAEPIDDHRTMFTRDGRNLHGVEIGATTLANLLDGSFLRPAGASVAAVVSIAAFAGLAVLTVRFAPAWGALLALAAALGYGTLALQAFSTRFAWWPLALPLAIALPGGWLFGVVHHYGAADRQRRRLREVFASVVPPDVVRQLGENAATLRSVRRDLTAACLATDAHQYTGLAERMRSAALFEFLNRYYEPLFTAVAQQGGFVSDVVGDSMLAIWPHRPATPDPRERVAEACLRIVAGADDLMRTDPAVGLLTRMGVAWGSVTLGFVGSAGHYEYRAVGDPVNTANRLQTLAGRLGVRIAVAGDFEAGVAGYVWRDLGDFVLRGRSTPLRVMELVGRTADVPEARQAELARFDRAIEHLRAGDREQARDLLQSVSPEPVVSFWLERVLAGTQATVMPAAP